MRRFVLFLPADIFERETHNIIHYRITVLVSFKLHT